MRESQNRAAISLRRLHVDGDHATAIVGQFGLVIWRGETTEDAVGRVYSMGLELIGDGSTPVCIIGIVEGSAKVPNAEARRLSARYNDEMADKGVVGYAGIMPKPGFSGAWIRGVITALHLLARKRYPFHMFGSTCEACEWLKGILGDSTINTKLVAALIEQYRDEYEHTWVTKFSKAVRTPEGAGVSS